MTAAAPTVTSAEPTPLRTELERVIGAYASLPHPARRAVLSTVHSFMGEIEITRDERDAALALVALVRADAS